jgi:oligopeptide/dipeptide ABC transporter ATP-binding protein
MSQSNIVLEARNLRKHFPLTKGFIRRRVAGWVKAVDGLSFTISKAQTLGLVGESGCGKTTTAKLILLLEQPTSGSILFEGDDIMSLTEVRRKEYSQSVQAVFQDPYGSLNPRMKVGDIIAEPLIVTRSLPRKAAMKRVKEVLADVGLEPQSISRYPHQFSGGQRQRIAVARALASEPKVIVLDEPVSALDVSIRAQLMNLLKTLQKRHELTYLLIAHDLAVIRHMSSIIGIMYVGSLVEYGDAEEIYQHPCHPYTGGLISAALPADPDAADAGLILGGEVPSPINPPAGCRFHPRCRYAKKICSREKPILRQLAADHFVACHFDLED